MIAPVTGIQALPSCLGETFMMSRQRRLALRGVDGSLLLQQTRLIYKSEAKASVDVLGLFGKFRQCRGTYNASCI